MKSDTNTEISYAEMLWLTLGVLSLLLGFFIYQISVIKGEYIFLDSSGSMFILIPIFALLFLLSWKKFTGFSLLSHQYGYKSFNIFRHLAFFALVFDILVYKYITGVYPGSGLENCFMTQYFMITPLEEAFWFSPWWLFMLYIIGFILFHQQKKALMILDIFCYLSIIYLTNISMLIFFSLWNLKGC
ncbi:MAG: hypothetical protein Q8O95_06125 [bacterium]|nr:hypothetical protein [bacterium]